MPSGSTFGRRLRALRLTLDMSQVELARRIGRHQTAIGPYERDEYEPPRDVVEKLAHVLETSPEYLYFGRSPQQIAAAGGRPASVAPACSKPRSERRWSWCSCAMSSCAAIGCATTAWRRCSGRGRSRWCLRGAGEAPAPHARPRRAGRARRRPDAAAPADAEQRPRPLRPRCLQCAASTDGRGARGQIHCRCAVAGSLA